MLGQIQAGIRVHKCATSTTNTRHTEVLKSSLRECNPTLHCKVPCVKVLTTANHRRTQFQYRVQQHATHNHSTRTAVPIRRIVSSSLKQQTQHNRSSSCSGSSPTMHNDASLHFQSQTAMKFTNHKTQIASQGARTHELTSISPQSTFETTSRQVPFNLRQVASIPPRQTNRSSRSHQHVVTQRRCGYLCSETS